MSRKTNKQTKQIEKARNDDRSERKSGQCRRNYLNGAIFIKSATQQWNIEIVIVIFTPGLIWLSFLCRWIWLNFVTQPPLFGATLIWRIMKLILTGLATGRPFSVCGTVYWNLSIDLLLFILGFHSRDQQLCFSTETKEDVSIIIAFNSRRIGSGHRHGRHFIVWGHQHGGRDIMWNPRIEEIQMNNTVATICSSMQNLKQMIQ